jgi:hypothetical protein
LLNWLRFTFFLTLTLTLILTLTMPLTLTLTLTLTPTRTPQVRLASYKPEPRRYGALPSLAATPP